MIARDARRPSVLSRLALGLATLALVSAALGACGAAARAQRSADTPTADKPKRTSSGSAGAAGRAREPRAVGDVQRGLSAWYGGELHGSPTASGERFDKDKLTAAHRTLPLGTVVRVTNDKNGKSVTLRINDRGPYGKHKRIIDVSEAAARELDFIDAGLCPVTLEVLSVPEKKAKTRQ